MYYSKKLYGSMSSGNLPPQEGLELWVDPSSINGNVWADKSGNGRNGIINGNPIITSEGITLNGIKESQQFVGFGTFDNFPSIENSTISCKIKTNFSGRLYGIFGKHEYNPSLGRFGFYHSLSNITKARVVQGVLGFNGLKPITDGIWHTLTLTKNSSNINNLYIDGILDISFNSNALNSNSLNLDIGIYRGAGQSLNVDFFMNGIVQNAFIYDRVLTESEILQISKL